MVAHRLMLKMFSDVNMCSKKITSLYSMAGLDGTLVDEAEIRQDSEGVLRIGGYV